MDKSFITPVAGTIFEKKNQTIFLERFFGRGISGEVLDWKLMKIFRTYNYN